MIRGFWTWSAGLVAVGLVAHGLFSVDWAAVDPVGEALAIAAKGEAATSAVPPAPPKPAALQGAEMPCFDCHSYERWQTEPQFNHPKHAGAGHCHSCHAFEGHFQITIREEHCDVCHTAQGVAEPLRGGRGAEAKPF